MPDLQSWMRDDPPLAPDWLRIGTDIIGGAAFNASFSLFGDTVGEKTANQGADSAGLGGRVKELSPALIDSLLGTTNSAGALAIPSDGSATHEPSWPNSLIPAQSLITAAHPRDLNEVSSSVSAPSPAHPHDIGFADWDVDFTPALA
jgi:hypothetical protein